MPPAEHAALVLLPHPAPAPTSPSLTNPFGPPSFPSMRAAAVLLRLASDYLDDASPTPTDRVRAYLLQNRAVDFQGSPPINVAINLFLTSIGGCGYSTDTAIEALERLYEGRSMPWDVPETTDDEPIRVTVVNVTNNISVEVRS